MRPSGSFNPDEDQTSEEARTIQHVVELLVNRRDELLKVIKIKTRMRKLNINNNI